MTMNEPIQLLTLSITVFLVIALLLTMGVDVIPLASRELHQHVRKHRIFQEMMTLPLGRMLGFRHVPVAQVRATLSWEEMQGLVTRCRACPNKAHCEEVLCGREKAGEYEFCFNRDQIARVKAM